MGLAEHREGIAKTTVQPIIFLLQTPRNFNSLKDGEHGQGRGMRSSGGAHDRRRSFPEYPGASPSVLLLGTGAFYLGARLEGEIAEQQYQQSRVCHVLYAMFCIGDRKYITVFNTRPMPKPAERGVHSGVQWMLSRDEALEYSTMPTDRSRFSRRFVEKRGRERDRGRSIFVDDPSFFRERLSCMGQVPRKSDEQPPFRLAGCTTVVLIVLQ